MLGGQEGDGVGGGEAQGHVPQEPKDLCRRVHKGVLGEDVGWGGEGEDVLVEGMDPRLLECHGR